VKNSSYNTKLGLADSKKISRMRLVLQKISLLLHIMASHLTHLSLGLLTLGTLASCSLPPREAWRQIQSEGLIPYVAREVRGEFNPDRPAPIHAVKPTSAIVQTKPTTAPMPTTVASSAVIGPERPSLPPPSQIAATSLPVAKPVEGLAGYVRSPYTNPPRLVDVRGMTTGSKVVCPYTRKPFLVPSGAQVSTQNVAEAPAKTPTPAPLPRVTAGLQPLPQPQLPPSNFVKEAPTEPTKVAANATQPPAAPPSKPNPEPPTAASSNPQPAPVKVASPPAAAEIPMGTAISGRPGFVNSPFAAKHQLVDVTGLPTGMEVKCPYTGKLFRVPPQANAPAETKPNP
jgi:hypothetical protein